MNKTDKLVMTSNMGLTEENENGEISVSQICKIPRNKILENDTTYMNIVSSKMWETIYKEAKNNPDLKFALVPFNKKNIGKGSE
jgi:hypothetical protein